MRFENFVGKSVVVQTAMPWFAVVGQRGQPIMVFEEMAPGQSMPRPFPFVRGKVRSVTETDIEIETKDLQEGSNGLVIVTLPHNVVAFVSVVEEGSSLILGGGLTRPS